MRIGSAARVLNLPQRINWIVLRNVKLSGVYCEPQKKKQIILHVSLR